MPTEWLALGSSLPAAFRGTHLACSGVRPAMAVLTGVNHSALLWVDCSSLRRTERSVGAGFAAGVWATDREAKASGRRRARRRMLGIVARALAEVWTGETFVTSDCVASR